MILKEHIHEIYGILDQSKYINQIPVAIQPTVIPISSQNKPQENTKRTTNDTSLFSSFTKSSASQILELNVTSLKNESILSRKGSFNLFNSLRSSNDTDSMIDVDISDDSDSETISISGHIDTRAYYTNDFKPTEPVLIKGSSVGTSNEGLSSTSMPTSPDIVTAELTDVYEVVVRLNDLQFCAQLQKDDICVLGRVFYVDIHDGNEFSRNGQISQVEKDNGVINLRFSKGPISGRKQYGADLSGFLEIRLLNEFFYLNQSTLGGLVELLEDDSSETGLPVKILIENCKINMSVSIF